MRVHYQLHPRRLLCTERSNHELICGWAELGLKSEALEVENTTQGGRP